MRNLRLLKRVADCHLRVVSQHFCVRLIEPHLETLRKMDENMNSTQHTWQAYPVAFIQRSLHHVLAVNDEAVECKVAECLLARERTQSEVYNIPGARLKVQT